MPLGFAGPSADIDLNILSGLFVPGYPVFSRSHLKLGLLTCLIILAATAILQAESTFAPWVNDALYVVETGSGASAIAICLALIATS
jgi:hypothetical protein